MDALGRGVVEFLHGDGMHGAFVRGVLHAGVESRGDDGRDGVGDAGHTVVGEDAG